MNVDYSNTQVIENINIIQNIYKISVHYNKKVEPGQFFMLRAWKDEPLLSRPVSVYDVEDNTVSFLYQIVGRGTEIFSNLKIGDGIDILGPLGNGFSVESMRGNIAIVTGGIGIAPMFYVSKMLKNCNVDLYAGFRDEAYALDCFENYVDNIYVSTEKEIESNLHIEKIPKEKHPLSKGYVTDLFSAVGYDMVLCCGPEVMMNKVLKECKNNNVTIYVSMEKHMACGIGACLVCACKTKNGNKRTCKDGPVFKGEELIVNE